MPTGVAVADTVKTPTSDERLQTVESTTIATRMNAVAAVGKVPGKCVGNLCGYLSRGGNWIKEHSHAHRHSHVPESTSRTRDIKPLEDHHKLDSSSKTRKAVESLKKWSNEKTAANHKQSHTAVALALHTTNIKWPDILISDKSSMPDTSSNTATTGGGGGAGNRESRAHIGMQLHPQQFSRYSGFKWPQRGSGAAAPTLASLSETTGTTFTRKKSATASMSSQTSRTTHAFVAPAALASVEALYHSSDIARSVTRAATPTPSHAVIQDLLQLRGRQTTTLDSRHQRAAFIASILNASKRKSSRASSAAVAKDVAVGVAGKHLSSGSTVSDGQVLPALPSLAPLPPIPQANLRVQTVLNVDTTDHSQLELVSLAVSLFLSLSLTRVLSLSHSL